MYYLNFIYFVLREYLLKKINENVAIEVLISTFVSREPIPF